MLETLVARENLNTVILNLYPGNKGYSLAFRQEFMPQNKAHDGLHSVFCRSVSTYSYISSQRRIPRTHTQ